MEVKITKSGGLIIQDGNGGRCELSQRDALSLVQSAQRLIHQLLSDQRRGGVKPVVTTTVADIRLNTDIHQTEIYLGMIDKNGTETGYAVPLELAATLADRMGKRVAEVKDRPPPTAQ